jgi:Gram-negative bacterial TonB protein C-terminal
MRRRNLQTVTLILAGVFGLAAWGHADDAEKSVRKAVELSTLNQPGTKPFHLKAVIAPSFDRDKGSNRTGEVEFWWVSPTQWKREVRSPDFHQVAVVNGVKEWQKNEGDYFPEWLRETCVALIEPVPNLDQVLVQVKDAEVKKLMGSTYYSWTMMSSNGKVEKGMGAGLAITDSTGRLFYGGGLGWDGLYKDYQSFHGRMIARTVSVGSPEITAKITTLEDLRDVPQGFFNAEAGAGDAPLIQTVVVEETKLRENLLPTDTVAWPALADGPLQGAVTTEIVVDRAGKVREVGTIVSDNPGISEVAGKAIAAMQFKPYLQNGTAVQVVSRITMSFKTARPAGMDIFDSARDYFERGRHVSFPAARGGQPYVLRATFQTRNSSGALEQGQYVDTWNSDERWRREATLGKSRFVRARDGETRYQLMEGPDAVLLRLVLKAMEPIPAIDTFVESDWRIKRDTVSGVKTIRVLAGYESPAGDLDPEHSRGYWFDEDGRLVKTYASGIETRRLDFADFEGAQVARSIQVLKNNALGMLIHVTDVSAETAAPEKTFKLSGHEWKRAFTDEVR